MDPKRRHPVLKKYRNQLKRTDDCDERNQLHQEFAQSTADLIKTKKLHDEIFAIHGFYKDINICVIQGRCHAPTACQLFAEDLQNFRVIYVRFLRDWSTLWDTDVMRSLEDFCTRCAEHLPPGEGRCSDRKAAADCDGSDSTDARPEDGSARG